MPAVLVTGVTVMQDLLLYASSGCRTARYPVTAVVDSTPFDQCHHYLLNDVTMLSVLSALTAFFRTTRRHLS